MNSKCILRLEYYSGQQNNVIFSPKIVYNEIKDLL